MTKPKTPAPKPYDRPHPRPETYTHGYVPETGDQLPPPRSQPQGCDTNSPTVLDLLRQSTESLKTCDIEAGRLEDVMSGPPAPAAGSPMNPSPPGLYGIAARLAAELVVLSHRLHALADKIGE